MYHIVKMNISQNFRAHLDNIVILKLGKGLFYTQFSIECASFTPPRFSFLLVSSISLYLPLSLILYSIYRQFICLYSKLLSLPLFRILIHNFVFIKTRFITNKKKTLSSAHVPVPTIVRPYQAQSVTTVPDAAQKRRLSMLKQSPIQNEKFMGVQLKPVTREKVEPQAAEQKEGAISKVYRFGEIPQCSTAPRAT